MERIEKMNAVLKRRLKSVTLVAEATYMRHNLSAMFRTAEVFGLQSVHFITEHNLNTSSASRGAERWIDISVYSSSEQCFKGLIGAGYSIYVADFSAKAYTPESLPVDKPIALVMGTELSGVSDMAKKYADGVVMIPMAGFTQSLNVSVATACLLQRITERRRALVGQGDLSEEERGEILNQWLVREKRFLKRE